MKILQTTTFKKQVKNLHKNQKQILDEAIKEVMANPTIGQMKKGDLADIRVYKFKILNQLYCKRQFSSFSYDARRCVSMLYGRIARSCSLFSAL